MSKINIPGQGTTNKTYPGENDETGSAVAEFVLLALPLFIPALLFFIALSNSINSEMETSMLARQAVSAFVGGEDDNKAHARTRLLLNEYEKLNNLIFGNESLKKRNSTSEEITYLVDCEATPCITPGAKVRLTLYLGYSVENELNAINESPAWVENLRDAKIDRQSNLQTDALSIEKLKGQRRAIASATAYVDKWR